MLDHQHDVAREERWRTAMQKEISSVELQLRQLLELEGERQHKKGAAEAGLVWHAALRVCQSAHGCLFSLVDLLCAIVTTTITI